MARVAAASARRRPRCDGGDGGEGGEGGGGDGGGGGPGGSGAAPAYVFQRYSKSAPSPAEALANLPGAALPLTSSHLRVSGPVAMGRHAHGSHDTPYLVGMSVHCQVNGRRFDPI